MNLRPSFLAAALLLGALPSRAMDLPFRTSVDLSLVTGTDALTKVTHRSGLGGAALGAQATLDLPFEGLEGRLGLQGTLLPGRQHGSARTDLRHIQCSGDLVFATRFPGLKGILGLSANRYSVTNSGSETFEIRETVIPNLLKPTVEYNKIPVSVWEVTTEDAAGLKLGLRLGAEYRLTSHLSVQALFQVTELGGGESQLDPNLPSTTPANQKDALKFLRFNRGAVNPSWLQVGARWTF